MDKHFSLLNLTIIFLLQKKRIVVHFLVVTIVAVAISYIIPKDYKATTLFLPPMDDGATIAGISIGAMLNTGRNSEFTPQQIESLLDSKRLLNAVISKFDLLHRYKTSKRPNKNEAALKILRKNIDVKMLQESGLTQSNAIHFSVSVIDKDRRRSADMANFLVDELGRIMDDLSNGQYRYAEDFIRGRLDSVVLQKEAVQERLAQFQKAHKIFSPDMSSQVLASVSTYAGLKQQKVMAEIQKEMLLYDKESGSREVRLIDHRIHELEAQMEEVENARKPDVIPGLNYAVDISGEYMDLMQEGTVLVKLELLLRQQYEEARIKSARRAPAIRVVDRASPPEWKNSPKKSVVVLVIVGIYMMCLMVSILASYRLSQASPQTREKLARFKDALKLRAG